MQNKKILFITFDMSGYYDGMHQRISAEPQQMIENIAKGRLGKFLKEVCLLNQEDIMDGKKTVREVLKEADPELQIVAFKRFTLRAE